MPGKHNERVVPKEVFCFPSKNLGGKLRSCAHHWFKTYEWAEYWESKDAILCKLCRHFAKVCHRGGSFANIFTDGGVNDWKHIKQKCEKHTESEEHKGSTTKYKEFQNTQKISTGSV